MREERPVTERLGRLDSDKFQHGILAVIVLAAVLVGLETSRGLAERHGEWLHRLDLMVLGIFAIEAALKIGRHGRRWYRYFGDPWDVFDFLIVVACVLPMGGQYAAVLRLARVLRAPTAGDGSTEAAVAGRLSAQVDPFLGICRAIAGRTVLRLRCLGRFHVSWQRSGSLPGSLHGFVDPFPSSHPGGLDRRYVPPDVRQRRLSGLRRIRAGPFARCFSEHAATGGKPSSSLS